MLLSINEWTKRIEKHLARVSPPADAFLNRRSLGLTHAVHDFLFTYYNFSPAKLKQWVPDFDEELALSPDLLTLYPWLANSCFHRNGEVLQLDRSKISESTRGLAQFVADLCRNILDQPPRFGCFGLHEWAMVYKLPEEEIRHRSHKLRLAPEALAEFVESQTLCCTHYDAYRFFTKEARPLNVMRPRLDTRLAMEQGGCLHANMDIYKWSAKLWPWIGSDFIAEAFFLAVDGRELDMRASPYDLIEEGYAPIKIETEAGRRHYQKEQELLAVRAFNLRKQLLNFCNKFTCETGLHSARYPGTGS